MTMRALFVIAGFIALVASAEGARADGGGHLTPPLAIMVVNSHFDHDDPGPYDTSAYLPFIRWDSRTDNSTYALREPYGGPCTYGDNCYSGHEGIDFQAASGTQVFASARGTVVAEDLPGEFGNVVKIAHDGGVATAYAHLLTWYVGNGQFVQRGDVIGLSGCSGSGCQGDHLHFGAYTSTYVDPNDWAWAQSANPDPYANDVGHLWGTRIGSFNSSTIAVKEGQLSAGWGDIFPLPGSGAITALSIDGSRIAIVRGGTAYARDTSLNTNGRPSSNGWQLIAYNALDIKLAGKRMAVLGTDRWLRMKDGALDSGWYDNVADNVWKIAITPMRIGVLKTSGELIVKEGAISSGWYQILGPGKAKDVALTDNWIGTIGAQSPYLDHFMATDVLQNSPPLSTIDTQVMAITMGGKGLDKRMGWVKGAHGRAKEEIIGGQNVDLGVGVEVGLNSGRAALRKSNGNIYISEGEWLGSIGGNLIATGSGVRLN